MMKWECMCLPHQSFGGPAATDRAGFFETWWIVHDENDYIQLQYHKATLDPLGFGLRSMRNVRASKKDINLHPYRIIIKLGVPYLVVASSDSFDDIQRAYDTLSEKVLPKILEERVTKEVEVTAEELTRAFLKLFAESLMEDATEAEKDNIATRISLISHNTEEKILYQWMDSMVEIKKPLQADVVQLATAVLIWRRLRLLGKVDPEYEREVSDYRKSNFDVLVLLAPSLFSILEPMVKDKLPALEKKDSKEVDEGKGSAEGDSEVPAEFVCPIGQDIMEDPVVCSDGITYDRQYITDWLTRRASSPMTNEVLDDLKLTPNLALKSLIGKWRKSHPDL